MTQSEFSYRLNLRRLTRTIGYFNCSGQFTLWPNKKIQQFVFCWYWPTRGLCYKTDYGRNHWSEDHELCFCVIKQWNYLVSGEMSITTEKWLNLRRNCYGEMTATLRNNRKRKCGLFGHDNSSVCLRWYVCKYKKTVLWHRPLVAVKCGNCRQWSIKTWYIV